MLLIFSTVTFVTEVANVKALKRALELRTFSYNSIYYSIVRMNTEL